MYTSLVIIDVQKLFTQEESLMRNFTRILTVVLAAMLLIAALSVSAFAVQTKFSDVSAKDETLSKAVSLLEGIGVTKGTSDTTFGTSELVTRQQMAAFVYRLMKKGSSIEGGENNTPFEDLYDDTYYSMISWASSMGIIKGTSATTFDPDGSITLQDAYTMVVRALGYEKNGALSYPFDYINIAEQNGVDLDKDVPSDVTYTSELTRGNVAIILYNAFFAETGELEIVQKEKELSNGKVVLEETEEYKKLCEKVYDVIEEEFQVRETQHYAFNDSKNSTQYKPTEEEDGTMLLVTVESDGKIDSFYSNPEELGLDGKSDSYIISHINLFYTYDDKEKEVASILYAEPLLQTASANTATYGEIDEKANSKGAEHFYNGNTSYPRMDGSMVVAGKTLYFYDAPFSFLQPSYTNSMTNEEKYDARNEDDTLLIDLLCLDSTKGTYSYYIRDERFGSKDGYGTDLDENLAMTLALVRKEGCFKMDIFDPDGDGRYEYMWYKPATFGQIIMDDDYDFSDYDEYKDNIPVKVQNKSKVANALKTIPTIYAGGATIDGAAFNDEDFVIAYVNGDANLIDVFTVAQAKRGYVNKINTPNAIVTIGNQNFRTCYQYNFVKGFVDDNSTAKGGASEHTDDNKYARRPNKVENLRYLITAPALDKEVIIYVVNIAKIDNVFFYEPLSSSSEVYSGQDILIPLADDGGVTQRLYDERTKKYTNYLKVWIGGEEKYVPVNVEESYPKPEKTVGGGYSFLFKDPITDTNGYEYQPYIDKICTYEVDKNGLYVIHSLLHGQDKDGEFDHIDLYITDDFFDEKANNQAGNDLNSEEVRLVRSSSKVYKIVDNNGYSLFGTYGDVPLNQKWFDTAYITDETTVIIKSVYEDEDEDNEYTIYKGQIPDTIENTLKNVQYIFENDDDNKKRANLVLLYAETEGDIEFEGKSKKTDWVIIKSSNPAKGVDDKYRYYYDVYDPFNGTIKEDVPGSYSQSTAASLSSRDPLENGAIIKLTSGGLVPDKNEPDDVLDAQTNSNLAFIVEVFEDDKFVEIAPVNEDDMDYFTDETTGEEYTFFSYDNSTIVTLIVLDDKKSFDSDEKNAIKVISMSDVAKADKTLLAYNDNVEDKNGNLKKKYAKYVKAYITYSTKKGDDNPVIDNMVVIVNPDEAEEYLEDVK